MDKETEKDLEKEKSVADGANPLDEYDDTDDLVMDFVDGLFDKFLSVQTGPLNLDEIDRMPEESTDTPPIRCGDIREDAFEEEEMSREEILEDVRKTREIVEKYFKDDPIMPYLWDVQIAYPDKRYMAECFEFGIDDTAMNNIRKKYGDYYEWQDAVAIWEDYYDKLLAKYGEKRWVKFGLKEGLIPEKIKKKPKLKMTRKNKQILKNGGAGIKPEPFPFTEEQLAEGIEYYTQIPEEIENLPEEAFEFHISEAPKYERKLIFAAFEKRVIGFRRTSLYKRKGITNAVSNLDAIQEFMNSRTVFKYDEKGVNAEEPSLSEWIDEIGKYDFWQEEIIDDRTKIYPVGFENGRIVKENDKDIAEAYSYLVEQGFDTALDGRKGVPKTAQRLIRRRLGSQSTKPLTAKERKKLKRSQKKAQKREKEAQRQKYEADRFLSGIIGEGDTYVRGNDGKLFHLGDTLKYWTD